VRIKRSTSFTLDEEHIKMLREMAEGLNVTASELIDSMIEFYFYNLNKNPEVWSTHDDGKIVMGEEHAIPSKNSQRKNQSSADKRV
jgi:hypothetical protein